MLDMNRQPSGLSVSWSKKRVSRFFICSFFSLKLRNSGSWLLATAFLLEGPFCVSSMMISWGLPLDLPPIKVVVDHYVGNFLPTWLLSTDQSWGCGWGNFHRSELGLTSYLSTDQSWGWPLYWNGSCSDIKAISYQRHFFRTIRVRVDHYIGTALVPISRQFPPIRVGVDLLSLHRSELGFFLSTIPSSQDALRQWMSH